MLADIAAAVVPPHFFRSELPMMDGRRESALVMLLITLTRCGTHFDVPPRQIDAKLQASLDSPRGVFIASPHAMLGMIGVRWLYDADYDPVVVTSANDHPVLGTGASSRVISRSSLFLVQVRNRLRSGGVVFACVDRAGHAEPRDGVECVTSAGIFHVPTAMFRVALDAGADIFFNVTTVTRRGAVIYRMVPPPHTSEVTAESLTEAFVAFVRDHVEAIAARDRKRSGVVALHAPCDAGSNVP